MRLKRVKIAAEMLEQFLMEGQRVRHSEIVSGLPEGAKLRFVQAWLPAETTIGVPRELWLDFEHASFPESAEGDEPAQLEIVVRQVDEHA